MHRGSTWLSAKGGGGVDRGVCLTAGSLARAKPHCSACRAPNEPHCLARGGPDKPHCSARSGPKKAPSPCTMGLGRAYIAASHAHARAEHMHLQELSRAYIAASHASARAEHMHMQGLSRAYIAASHAHARAEQGIHCSITCKSLHMQPATWTTAGAAAMNVQQNMVLRSLPCSLPCAYWCNTGQSCIRPLRRPQSCYSAKVPSCQMSCQIQAGLRGEIWPSLSPACQPWKCAKLKRRPIHFCPCLHASMLRPCAARARALTLLVIFPRSCAGGPALGVLDQRLLLHPILHHSCASGGCSAWGAPVTHSKQGLCVCICLLLLMWPMASRGSVCAYVCSC